MSFGTIIIGSGVVAAAIAQRLLEKDAMASILILEAGQRIKLMDYALWTDYLLYKRAPHDACRDWRFRRRTCRARISILARRTWSCEARASLAMAAQRLIGEGGRSDSSRRTFACAPTLARASTGPSTTMCSSPITEKPRIIWRCLATAKTRRSLAHPTSGSRLFLLRLKISQSPRR